MTADVEPGAHALLTTPAATKAYRTAGAPSIVENRLRVAPGGVLEWLPQETILYDGCDLALHTRVDLAAGAAFLGIDVVCFGLPARDDSGFARGRCRQDVEVWRDGVPLVLERGRFDGDGAVQSSAWGLAGAPVMGTLFVAPASPAELGALATEIRARADQLADGELGAATVLGGGAVLACRYVGPSVERGGRFLREAWALARRALLGRDAVAPRIWAT